MECALVYGAAFFQTITNFIYIYYKSYKYCVYVQPMFVFKKSKLHIPIIV